MLFSLLIYKFGHLCECLTLFVDSYLGLMCKCVCIFKRYVNVWLLEKLILPVKQYVICTLVSLARPIAHRPHTELYICALL